MNHLLRELAPLSERDWQVLDDEARQRLTPALAARRLVDFSGPHGWEHSATNLGRTETIATGPADGVSGIRRRVLPLVELRANFDVLRPELRDTDRGADDGDWGALDAAAHQLASAENTAVLHGWQDVFAGVGERTPHDPIPLGEDAGSYAQPFAAAVEVLLQSGIDGPYGIALGSGQYRQVLATTEHGGYPLLEHLRRVVEGPIVWAPGVNAAFVVSQRGGDFIFDSGQDISIGYDAHDGDVVRLYLEESFSFHVATPEAAVALTA
jgi:uncharacterized linocin/CFP29 family protein